MKGATTSGKITANDISAGDWTGSLNFNVKFDVSEMTINVTNGETTYDGNATNGGAKVEVVSPSNGYTITYGTTNGTYDLDEMPTYTNPGTYEVYYQVVVSNYTTKTGSLTITINEGLNGYTWEEVSAICANGEAKSYFKVGDEAVICLGEMDSMEYGYYETLGEITTLDKQMATIVVGDITDTSLTLLFTNYDVQAPAYQMNLQTYEYPQGTNIGGWEVTILREWLNNESNGGFYNALSSSLKNVISTHVTSYSATFDASEVSYCIDKLWLLSSKEVFGGEIATRASSITTYYENLAAFNAETQLAYFANGNSRIRYSSGTNACWWWLRSSIYHMSSGFSDITNDGSIYANGARNSRYVFPAFTIGQPSLNDYSWSEIQGICRLGLANEYFNVGDTKTIELGEMENMVYFRNNNANTMSTLTSQTAKLALADISSNGTSITCLFISYSMQAPYYQMNPKTTTYECGMNIGGWEATTLRKWLNSNETGGFYNALPSNLKDVIKTHSSSYSAIYTASDVSYCDDNLWLLSAKEIFGGIATSAGAYTTYYENFAAFNAETQLAYFVTNPNKLRYNSDNEDIAIGWWTRSSAYDDNKYFVRLDIGGVSSKHNACDANGVFPAFDIG
jgi:hypothetical protein